MTFVPADQAERERILSDLSTNMLVEAGAGSGKTTSLVGRLANHVRNGTPVDKLAAVTFTRKAANELRERFRNRLERELQSETNSSEERGRFAEALHELDRAFLGTIHSFCGRILREHPLDAGLDPTFQEVSSEDMTLLERTFWRRWIDRQEREGSAEIEAVRAVGIDPGVLYDAFVTVRTYPDVQFDSPAVAVPDIAPLRHRVESLLADARALRPSAPPQDGWDPLMLLTRRLDRDRTVEVWSSPVAFCWALEWVTASACKVTQKRWGSSKDDKASAKALGEAFTDLATGDIADLLRRWREHRYPMVMRVLQRAATDFARERHATGNLGFEDLLLLSAKLLRDHPAVRDELGQRYAHLLVDEFQDTDPIQAEVCFLLASPSSEGTDWRTVTPRPGSLFVVGDPKQSIYRFRRADIGVYESVKRKLHASGAVLALTSNFRSAQPIGATVNAHFAQAFPEQATREQAAFSPMNTIKSHEASRVAFYEFGVVRGAAGKDVVVETDASLVASYIADCIARDGAKAGDFLVLTREKAPVSQYARALAQQNIPATTTGAALPQELELRELLIVLRAIADPDNNVYVVAALEGLFFGLSAADLWSARQSRLHFVISHRPNEEITLAGHALAQLHAWWIVSQQKPVDVLLEQILSDTGLLFHATSQELGDARAGALLHIIEMMRAASTVGAGSVTAAIERLDALLTESMDDISLRPGRSDAVRVMNVHQAKGLEAPVVILAAPTNRAAFPPRVHITRSDDGQARGGVAIGYRTTNGFKELAQCVGWDAMLAAESAFALAEETRLLYVAATRAERELLVARCVEIQKSKNKPDSSMWRPLAPVIDATGVRVDITLRAPQARQSVTRSAAELAAQVTEVHAGVEAAKQSSFAVQTVTQSIKDVDDVVPYVLRESGGGDGPAWGRAVHRVIEAYYRGRRDAHLVKFARAVAKDERLPDTQASDLEQFAGAVDATLSATVPADTRVMPELTVMRHAAVGESRVITEGVIDAAALRDGAWEILDWKTDRVSDERWAERRVAYERQVGEYASMLSELTQMGATARVERVLRER
jgi:ATP-dependent helicase/nuclease subunit A